MEGLWEKRGTAAYPVDEKTWSYFHRLPNNARWIADSKDPTRRSGDQHRFWFALAGTLFSNQEKYADFNSFRMHLLVYLGYFEEGQTVDGRTVAIPKSLKFGKMSADEFGALVDATLDFAESIGWNRADLLAQTREYAGSVAA